MNTKTFLCSFIILHCANSFTQECDIKHECVKLNPDSSSIIYRRSLGRVGNQLFTLKMILSLKLQFGYQVFLSKEIARDLATYFPHLEEFVPFAEDRLCEGKIFYDFIE